MTMQQQVLPLTGIPSQDARHYRGDHLLVAQMVAAEILGAMRFDAGERQSLLL